MPRMGFVARNGLKGWTQFGELYHKMLISAIRLPWQPPLTEHTQPLNLYLDLDCGSL